MGEIGSFIELQFPKNKEYYSSSDDIIRLNSGRAAIWHALRVLNCDKIVLPHYQCESVRDFLIKKDITIRYYYIDQNFKPLYLEQHENEAILIVNYFGINSERRMKELAESFENVIIDNSQAFFCKPISNCLNVYSARKFVGTPDGAYVIGKNANKYFEEYDQGFSSDTSLFLLQRIEYGCEGRAYSSRVLNENRIEAEDIKLMSQLTWRILDGTDYDDIIDKRKSNFIVVHEGLKHINELDPLRYYDRTCVPMVYPLLVEFDNLLELLIRIKHFQGHWWNYILEEVENDTFEYRMSKYMIPITIDQRYGEEEIEELIKYIQAVSVN